MIVFDLRCGQGHVFEAWLASSVAYEEQRTRGLLSCPSCGDGKIDKAMMAPNIGVKGNATSLAETRPAQQHPPQLVKAAMRELAAAQTKMLEDSKWVGRSFADRARAMHAGEIESAPIHGQATPREAKALVEEGVPCAPLLLPVIPPEALN
ncbi:MAG: DUF1178 family protein [Sphingomonas sp.]